MRNPLCLVMLLVSLLLGLPDRAAAQPVGPGPTGVSPNLMENSLNTAVGVDALASNTTGVGNTAVGANALKANTMGLFNTASGGGALEKNIEGHENTANGFLALYSSVIGSGNTAIGSHALHNANATDGNTAIGAGALESNTFGWENTATGAWALSGDGGYGNTANGAFALSSNGGSANTAVGGYALRLSSAYGNVALGYGAGYEATTGHYNVFIGAEVVGTAADTNTIRIGLPNEIFGPGTGQNQTFIAGIYGTQLSGTAHAVFVDENGRLGTVTPGVLSGDAVLPVSQLQQQVRDQHRQLRDQQSVISELRSRLDRLEALVAKAARTK